MKTMNAIGIVIVAVLLVTGSASAQPAGPKPAPSAAQDGFVPVDSPVAPEDAMPAPRLVAIAYAFIWLAFFGYLLSIKMRLSNVEQEMAAISRRAAGPRP